MIERIEGMPAGTIGLRASGKLSKEDYRAVLEPALDEAIESGELRLVFRLTDFDGLEANAWIEDVKTGLGALVRDHSAWRRFALVTDVEWVAKAFRLFTWMTPGEVKIFDLGGLEEAKTWVAG
ncbi:MAG TPA: STAS/SEC14 domain-containing protein [Solirubrobacterales bacterium]|nr:STAS/SEC14 domain-containing protein [Solirubrobacterales bacterium]